MSEIVEKLDLFLRTKTRQNWFENALQHIKDKGLISFAELRAQFTPLTNGKIAFEFDTYVENYNIRKFFLPKKGKPKFYIDLTGKEILKKLFENWGDFELRNAINFEQKGFSEEEKNASITFIKDNFSNFFRFDNFGIYVRR
jgi:hypothetical protein